MPGNMVLPRHRTKLANRFFVLMSVSELMMEL